jgi:hypothetical protein
MLWSTWPLIVGNKFSLACYVCDAVGFHLQLALFNIKVVFYGNFKALLQGKYAIGGLAMCKRRRQYD